MALCLPLGEASCVPGTREVVWSAWHRRPWGLVRAKRSSSVSASATLSRGVRHWRRPRWISSRCFRALVPVERESFGMSSRLRVETRVIVSNSQGQANPEMGFEDGGVASKPFQEVIVPHLETLSEAAENSAARDVLEINLDPNFEDEEVRHRLDPSPSKIFTSSNRFSRVPQIQRAAQSMVITNVDTVSAEESLSEKNVTNQLEVGDLVVDVDGQDQVESERSANLQRQLSSEVERIHSKDEWLTDFQRQLLSEVNRIHETGNHVSNYSGLSWHTSRRRVLGAPMLMSLLLAFGWSSPNLKISAS